MSYSENYSNAVKSIEAFVQELSIVVSIWDDNNRPIHQAYNGTGDFRNTITDIKNDATVISFNFLGKRIFITPNIDVNSGRTILTTNELLCNDENDYEKKRLRPIPEMSITLYDNSEFVEFVGYDLFTRVPKNYISGYTLNGGKNTLFIEYFYKLTPLLYPIK